MERAQAQQDVEHGGVVQPVVDARGQTTQRDGVHDVLEHLADDVGDAETHAVEHDGPEQAGEEVLDAVEGIAELVQQGTDDDQDDQAKDSERGVEEEGRHGGLRVFAVEGVEDRPRDDYYVRDRSRPVRTKYRIPRSALEHFEL